MEYTGTSTRASCHVYCIKHEDFSCYNESSTGADASVEALKLYHMKLTLGLAYSIMYSSLLALLAIRVQKMGNDRRDRC